MNKPLTIAICCAAIATFAGLTHAAGNAPLDFLKSKNEQLQTLAKNTDANKAKMIEVLRQMIDFDALAKESLGKHWDTRSDAQRQEYSKNLRALVERNIINRLKDSKTNKVTYDSATPSSDNVLVATTVGSATDPRAEKTQIVYKLKSKASTWGVIDMITDDVSLVENYRVEFSKIINDKGWDGLIQKMKDELAKPPAK